MLYWYPGDLIKRKSKQTHHTNKNCTQTKENVFGIFEVFWKIIKTERENIFGIFEVFWKIIKTESS